MKVLPACAMLLLALSASTSSAGGKSGRFDVKITLQDGAAAVGGNTICVSESLSAQTNAVVRVACQTGQFVDISPQPGRPFAGVHGGAFRFAFGPGHWVEASLAGSADNLLGTGTVTAMRIYRVDEDNGPLEMLVSF